MKREITVTDDYLFHQKEYKQKHRTFVGVNNPKYLWGTVYITEGTYEKTKSECIRAYGFYYEEI